MTINGMLAYTDSIIILLQFLVFATFCLLSYQRLHALFFGGTKDVLSEADANVHSCFLSALTVIVFHFTASSVRELVLVVDMEKLELRQFFYFMMLLLEFSAVMCLFFLHKLRKCIFSNVARFIILLAVILSMNLIMQYYFHALNDSESYTQIYRGIVLLCNILTLAAVGFMPLVCLRTLRKQN